MKIFIVLSHISQSRIEAVFDDRDNAEAYIELGKTMPGGSIGEWWIEEHPVLTEKVRDYYQK